MPVTMLAIPAGLLLIQRAITLLDPQFFDPQAHLVVVAGIAALALCVASVAVVASRWSRNPNLVYLAIGAAGLGIFMLGHGLTTPGVHGMPMNSWVGRLPYLAIASFSIGLFLASRPVTSRAHRLAAGAGTEMLVGSIVLMAILTIRVCLDPETMHGTVDPAWFTRALDVVLATIVLSNLAVMWTHWRRWQLGNDVVQMALVFAAAMSIAAAVSMRFGTFTRLSWWDYHVYLLAGFGCAVFAILHRSRRSRRVTDVLQNAFSDQPFEHIAEGYPEALRRLVKAVEVKDAYTHGHSARTAQIATALGVKLAVSPTMLRVIARGAYLHDLGKIGIPDSILNKPGRLTDEEREVIETHPVLGHEIAAGSPSLREALEVILHHHERYDGKGYPDGLAADAVPFEARVVAVADVWDALISDRSYRKGWAPSEALAHIVAGSGTHFDPEVVDAMVELAAEWGIRSEPDAEESEEIWEAVESCHQLDNDAEVAELIQV